MILNLRLAELLDSVENKTDENMLGFSKANKFHLFRLLKTYI